MILAKDKAFYKKSSIRISGELMTFELPRIMGILNINGDSFFDGGAYTETQNAVDQCGKMLEEGADIIDIGPASSKPGSKLIEPEAEWKIVEPILKALKEEFPQAYFSLDTYNSQTAEKSVRQGVHIINDISGGIIDPRMVDFIGDAKLPYIMMHMQGLPENMQLKPAYQNVLKEVAYFFSHQIEAFRRAGAIDIVLDPGFGFGKSLEHNYTLFNGIDYFQEIFEMPLLVGISRKSMINKVLGTKAEDALNGTTVLNTLALQKDANILRVHDVKEAVEARKILNFSQKF